MAPNAQLIVSLQRSGSLLEKSLIEAEKNSLRFSVGDLLPGTYVTLNFSESVHDQPHLCNSRTNHLSGIYSFVCVFV